MGKRVTSKYLKMNKEDLKKEILNDRKKYSSKIPSNISKQFQVDKFMEGGYKSYRIVPKENFSGEYIVYLHGGYMCYDITPEQWEFIYKLSMRTKTGIFVPIYPLAPVHSCRELFDMLTRAYSNFAKGFDVEKVIFLGDSSGAGLALSLSMLAWKEGFRKPDKLILLSPMLDTEFFDKDLEEQLKNNTANCKYIFYNDAVKDFLNSYWVKDYAAKTEYTSPYYEDYTDLCDDVIVFSGERDLYNCYAKAFYNKAKQQGVNVRLFQFEGEYHNFLIHSGSDVQKEAFEYLVDVINGTYNASAKDLFPIKTIAHWSRKYPEVIKDEWAVKFIYDNKFEFTKNYEKLNEYRKLLMISRYRACDGTVRQFIMKYPKCTIVNVGCHLDNMFQRLDNGRILWYSVDSYNTISVRRSMYGDLPREKTIGRGIMDFSWLDDIRCKRNQGVMFMFNDALTTFKMYQIKELFEQIRKKFPGAEVAFVALSTDAAIYNNLSRKNRNLFRGKLRMRIDDTQKVLYSWRPDYKIMSEDPILKYRPDTGIKKLKTKIATAYNLITYNHKIIHLKLGSEEYDVKI